MRNPNTAASGNEMIVRMGLQKSKKKKKPSKVKKLILNERLERLRQLQEKKDPSAEDLSEIKSLVAGGVTDSVEGHVRVAMDSLGEGEGEGEGEDDGEGEGEGEKEGEGEGEEEDIKTEAAEEESGDEEGVASDGTKTYSESSSIALESNIPKVPVTMSVAAAPFIPSFLKYPSGLPTPSQVPTTGVIQQWGSNVPILSTPEGSLTAGGISSKSAESLEGGDDGSDLESDDVVDDLVPSPTPPSIGISGGLKEGESGKSGKETAPLLFGELKPGERRRREYVDHELNKSIDTKSMELLAKLQEFDHRSRATIDKSALLKSKLRLTMGLREVTKGLKMNRIKAVIIAPDIEDAQEAGSLNDKIIDVIKLAIRYKVRIIYALNRRKLSKCFKKKAHVSCVGIFDYSGADGIFKELMELVNDARAAEAGIKNQFVIDASAAIAREMEAERLQRAIVDGDDVTSGGRKFTFARK
jgi:ribosomal protein L7Ae-like RNA K-turn-binding protein